MFINKGNKLQHIDTQQIHKIHKYKMTSHNKLSHLSHWCRCGVDFLGRPHKIEEECKKIFESISICSALPVPWDSRKRVDTKYLNQMQFLG